MGHQGGKSDMERLGIFSEQGYVTIGDNYKSSAMLQFNDAATKGKQMLVPGPKERCATQVGYFSEKYSRVFEGESYNDPIKLRRQQRQKDVQKFVGGKPFFPSAVPKKPSGAGSYFGTLSGPIPHLSAETSSAKAERAPGKNVLTNPPKKGTGYGYVNVTLGKYWEHLPDPYGREEELLHRQNSEGKSQMKGGPFKVSAHPFGFFDANPFKSERAGPTYRDAEKAPKIDKVFKPSSYPKVPGGCHDGTFTKYPPHSEDKYVNPGALKLAKEIVNNSGKKFIPSSGPKGVPQPSVIDVNIHKSLTPLNFQGAESVLTY